MLQQEAKRAPNASITAAQSPPALQGPYAQQLTKDYSVPWDHEGLVWLAKEYGLTTPQLIFNWALARLGAIVVATANEQHMRQALNETAMHGNALKWPSLRYLNSLGTLSQANNPESEAKGTRQQHGQQLSLFAAPLSQSPPQSSPPVVPVPAPVVRVQNIIGNDEFYSHLNADYPLPGRYQFSDDFPWKRELDGRLIREEGGVNGLAIWYDSPHMATILERSPAWRHFDDYVNSAHFLDYALNAFRDKLATSNELLLDWTTLASRTARRHIWHSQIESMEIAWYRRSRDHPFNQTYADPHELYTIWSFQAQRLPAGAVFKRMKGPHRDQENRILSLVIYFTDGEPLASGWSGGEFVFYDGKTPKKAGTRIYSARPNHNLGLMFLCNRNSIHSINALSRANGEFNQTTAYANMWRKTVYLSIASRSSSWRYVSMPGLGRELVLK